MRSCLLALCLVAIGCNDGGEGTTVLSSGQLFPSTWKNADVTLRIANLEIPAQVAMTEGGTRRKLTISRDGAVLEEEIYDVTTEHISLVQLGTRESFSPPIRLLSFPVEFGQAHEWQGQMLLADTEVQGSATSISERALADVPTGSIETVLVTVSLRLTEDGKPAERKLRIWFAGSEGPIKRDFGNQVREPRVSQ